MSANFWEVMRKTVYKPEKTLEQFAVRVGRVLEVLRDARNVCKYKQDSY